MNPLQVSARFAAYTWYEGTHPPASGLQDEALLFARDNWAVFAPCAHEGLGRLLLRISAGRKGGTRRPVRHVARRRDRTSGTRLAEAG